MGSQKKFDLKYICRRELAYSLLFLYFFAILFISIFICIPGVGGDVIQALTVIIMPLYYADDSIDPYTLHRVPEQFIIFYSSITEDGQMWCPVDTPLYLQFCLC